MSDATQPGGDEPPPSHHRTLVFALIGQVIIGALLLTWVAIGRPVPGLAKNGPAGAADSVAPRAKVDHFNGARAFRYLERQVRVFGVRPAGSTNSRRLAEELRRLLPNGTFQAVPGGLRNVVGTLPGTGPPIVIGAHYDSAALPKFVGANDGAAGVAALLELARNLQRTKRGPGAPPLRFVMYDGEELPPGGSDDHFEAEGLRGSKVDAQQDPKPQAMILLDYIAERHGMHLRRERNSNPALWGRLRTAAKAVGTSALFPNASSVAIIDDHVPYLRAGVPAIDLIDFDYPQTHTPQDDLAHVSERSLDAVGETVLQLLRTW